MKPYLQYILKYYFFYTMSWYIYCVKNKDNFWWCISILQDELGYESDCIIRGWLNGRFVMSFTSCSTYRPRLHFVDLCSIRFLHFGISIMSLILKMFLSPNENLEALLCVFSYLFRSWITFSSSRMSCSSESSSRLVMPVRLISKMIQWGFASVPVS